MAFRINPLVFVIFAYFVVNHLFFKNLWDRRIYRSRKRHMATSPAVAENRFFQSNGHFWKSMNLFLVPLGSFLGMHSSNFLSEVSGNFRTFELTFIFFYFAFSSSLQHYFYTPHIWVLSHAFVYCHSQKRAVRGYENRKIFLCRLKGLLSD